MRRQLTEKIRAFETIDGPGLHLRRSIPAGELPAVGPFIMLDDFGPEPMPAGKEFPPNPHPHAGIETLTYLLEGALEHRDSAGGAGVVEAGGAQWMRAGSGLVHDEGVGASLREHGGAMHGLQLWINLPRGRKQVKPDYRALQREDIPELVVGDARVRLLAGAIGEVRGPVTTFADPFAAHVGFGGAGRATLAVPAGIELGAYVIRGAASVGGAPVAKFELALLGAGDAVEIATDGAADILVVGGPPLDAPIVRMGPFVMNTPGEIQAAIRDYRSGKMGTL